MRRRRLAHRLPLSGVAVAGAVIGHMVAYVLAVPEATVRVALLGATGHAYWTEAIAAATVLGLASLATTLRRQFRAGLMSGRPQPGEHVGRLAGQLAGFQIAIYLVQEALERLEAGIPPHALLDGHLLMVGVAVQSVIAVVLAAPLPGRSLTPGIDSARQQASGVHCVHLVRDSRSARPDDHHAWASERRPLRERFTTEEFS